MNRCVSEWLVVWSVEWVGWMHIGMVWLVGREGKFLNAHTQFRTLYVLHVQLSKARTASVPRLTISAELKYNGTSYSLVCVCVCVCVYV